MLRVVQLQPANIQLANGRYQAQVKANKVPLQRLAAVPPQFQGAVKW